MDGEPNPDQFRRPGDPLRVEGPVASIKPVDLAPVAHTQEILGRTDKMSAEEEATLQEILQSTQTETQSVDPSEGSKQIIADLLNKPLVRLARLGTVTFSSLAALANLAQTGDLSSTVRLAIPAIALGIGTQILKNYNASQHTQ